MALLLLSVDIVGIILFGWMYFTIDDKPTQAPKEARQVAAFIFIAIFAFHAGYILSKEFTR